VERRDVREVSHRRHGGTSEHHDTQRDPEPGLNLANGAVPGRIQNLLTAGMTCSAISSRGYSEPAPMTVP